MYGKNDLVINISKIDDLYRTIQDIVNEFYLHSLEIKERENNIEKLVSELLMHEKMYTYVHYGVLEQIFYSDQITFNYSNLKIDTDEIVIKKKHYITIPKAITTIAITYKSLRTKIPVEITFHDCDEILRARNLIKAYKIPQTYVYSVKIEDETHYYYNLANEIEYSYINNARKFLLKRIKISKTYNSSNEHGIEEIKDMIQFILELKNNPDKTGTIQLLHRIMTILDDEKIRARKITGNDDYTNANLYITVSTTYGINLRMIADTIDLILREQISTINNTKEKGRNDSEKLAYNLDRFYDSIVVTFTYIINKDIVNTLRLYIHFLHTYSEITIR